MFLVRVVFSREQFMSDTFMVTSKFQGNGCGKRSSFKALTE